jgi:hypothetical protein
MPSEAHGIFKKIIVILIEAFLLDSSIDLAVFSECILIGETSRLQAVQQFMAKNLPTL